MTAPPRHQVLIAQLTDTHVLAADDVDTEVFVDNNARFEEAIDAINRESPAVDVVVGSGDLANDGRSEEYDALVAGISRLEVPFLPLPGNHDDPSEIRARFPSVPWADGGHASWVTVVSGVRLVGLDSTRAGEHGAEFDTGREAWLRDVLSSGHEGTTILFLHHPPFTTGIRWMDDGGFVGLDRLVELLGAHPVDRILCGHLHRPMVSTVAGIAAQVGMSTVQHVDLDLGVPGAVAVIDDPIGYQIHRVADGSMVTHARFIRTGEPMVPTWAADYA